MGASRKLQTEIDRVLKRVSEGVLDFDNIWDKVHGTENANLKEKFEGDLKKEIKKLQRYRDQIKTWQQSNEAKDKKALMDARKLIERDMERFKIFEKEMKTKAFSKEGLGQQPKTDPVEKAKSETRDWLNNVVGDLEYQNDNFEAELEGISAKKGKTKNPQLTHLETSITRHKAHILKLELILRLLDNDELSPDQVNEIRYYMEDYIECNQLEFERFSDIDELYASLPLDKVEALEDTLGTSSYVKAALLSHSQQNADQSDEQTSEDRKSDFIPTTPTAKTADEGPLASSSSSTVISGQSAAATSSSLVHSSASVKEVDNDAFADARPSIVIPEIGPDRGIGNEESNQEPISAPMSLSLLSGISSRGVIGSVSSVSESFRNVLSADETTGSSCVSPALASNLSGRMISLQVLKVNDDTISNDYRNAGEGPGVSGSIFTPSVVTSQWRPQSAAAFQNQIEIRGRPEIAPDQREKYIQRLQKLQQQGHGANLSASHLPMQQQENSIIQQFNSQSSPISPHMGVRFNIQSSSQSVIAPTKLQNPVQLSSQNLLVSSLPKDAGDDQAQQHQQRNLYDDMNIEITRSSGFGTIKVDDNLKTVHMASNAMAEVHQLPRYGNLSPGPPLQPGQSSSNVGVIGRGIVSDPGAGVDNLGSSFDKSRDDHFLGLHLLEAALHRLPQTDDSYRYIPKHPAVTPLSFPQTQAGFARDPAFWRNIGFDIMFFSFYYQQNTYQQYMAARELKRQKWRYNKRYNLWLQPHDLKIEADDYEKGTYLLFDYDVVNGWCPRYLQDFVFEYRYREDELDVPDD